MTASSLLLFLLWSHLMTLAWGYYFSDTTYSTGSSASYTWSSAFPQSCTCMENAVTKSSCSLFRCNCACDLTAQVCDYGCCCDPDCSSEQLSRFQTLGGCPVSSSSNTVPLCYSSVELYKINPRLPLSGQPTAEAAVADALCVSKYNYATKGEYYTTAEVQDSVIFQQSKGQKDYVYGDVSPLAVSSLQCKPCCSRGSFYLTLLLTSLIDRSRLTETSTKVIRWQHLVTIVRHCAPTMLDTFRFHFQISLDVATITM